MTKIDIGNVTDDEMEQLILFARSLAGMRLYGAEMEEDGIDAMTTLNCKIAEARELLRDDSPRYLPVVDGDENATVYGWALNEEEALDTATNSFVDEIDHIECYGPIKTDAQHGFRFDKAWVAITKPHAEAEAAAKREPPPC